MYFEIHDISLCEIKVCTLKKRHSHEQWFFWIFFRSMRIWLRIQIQGFDDQKLKNLKLEKISIVSIDNCHLV
jgi:hypothetical protein